MSTLPRDISPASLFPYAKWGPLVRHLAKQYRSALPFPHIHLAQFLEPEAAKMMAEEFPRPGSADWIHYKHANENKLGLNRRLLFPNTIAQAVNELSSESFLGWLRELTGIPNLIADPSLEGGGLHQSGQGGFLNIHTDFSVHHHHFNWERRINLILYLSADWQEDWGGALEFWAPGMSECGARYLPYLNHAVIFNTSDSLHGFPDPIRCPDDVYRKSLALYYYTIDPGRHPLVRSTHYHARPKDGALKAVLIRLDTLAVSLYSKAKRRFQFSDKWASRLLKIAAKFRPSRH